MSGRLQYLEYEAIPPLEYSAHTIWAEARGLAQLIRQAHPSELDAVRDELREAADFILRATETAQ